MHFCIQFSYRFWIRYGMNFLSEVQMFHNAGTLKKLFPPQFLQCFVNVALFRTRTAIIDNLPWNAKKQSSELDRKSIKNQSKNVFFESSESDRVSDSILGTFWHHFGTILGGLGVHLPPFRLSWSLRGRLLGVCSAVLGPLGPVPGAPFGHQNRYKMASDCIQAYKRTLGGSWRPLGTLLEPLGALLERSWRRF